MKGISKGSLASSSIHLDAGSTDRSAQQSLQILEDANKGTYPSWLFNARLPVTDRLTSSRPDVILVIPLPIKSKPPSPPHLQQVQQARSDGDLRRAHEFK